jgi:hypothetical protein
MAGHMAKGPHRRRTPLELKLEGRIRNEHEANHGLMFRFDEALKNHGPDILRILADIEKLSDRGDAIDILADERGPHKAMRRIHELGIRRGE